MRVLFFISEFTRFYGAQRSLLMLLKELPRSGVEPIVVFPGEGKCADVYREAGLDVRILEGPRIARAFGQNLLEMSTPRKMAVAATQSLPYSLRLAALVRSVGAQILHVNTPRSLFLAGPFSKLLGVPVVFHVRGLLSPFNELQRHALGALATRLILVADAVKDDVPPLFHDKCVTIYNAVDESLVGKECEDDSRAPTEPPVVLCVGAIIPAKGQHHLLRAAALVNQRVAVRPRFVFLGADLHEGYRRHLNKLIKDLDLDNVEFKGWVDDPFSYYRRATLIAFPSVTGERLETAEGVLPVESGEGLPRAVLEAMFLGKAVVATRIAGVSEMIDHGRTGLIVPQGDAEQMANQICHLLVDEPARQAMARAAQKRARESFSTEVMVQKTSKLFREVARL